MKKKVISLIIVVLIICGVIGFIFFKNNKQLKKEVEKAVDAIKYNMELELDTKKNNISGSIKMDIKNNTAQEIDELVIRDMSPAILKYNKENYGADNATQKTKIEDIAYNNKSVEIRKELDDSVIYLKLSKPLKPKENATISVKIATDIPNRQDRFGYVKRDYGTIYTLSFCFPYLADNVDGKWITDPYFDDGESRSYDLADYEVTIKHPKNFVMAATGKSATNDGITKINAEKVRDFAIVASDFIKKTPFEVNGITINNYLFENKNSDVYKKLTELVIENSIKLYTDNIGKYPYDELDVLPCNFGFAFGGMEYPGLVMTNAASFFEGPYMDAWSLADGLAHEIAHQWFYATVGNREYIEGWIDEAFTTYAERDIFGLIENEAYIYLESIDDLVPSLKDRIKSRDELVNDSKEMYNDTFINIPPHNYSENQSYGEGEYEAGYLFLEEVRVLLGDNIFSKMLKEYYETYSFEVVNTNDIINLFKKYDNSKKMNELINFYIK